MQWHELVITHYFFLNFIEIQADELQASLAKAGIDMSDADLEQFIKAMDKDGDGAIDFEEWRDFLVVSGSGHVHSPSPSGRGADLACWDIPINKETLDLGSIGDVNWSDTPPRDQAEVNMAQKDDLL